MKKQITGAPRPRGQGTGDRGQGSVVSGQGSVDRGQWTRDSRATIRILVMIICVVVSVLSLAGCVSVSFGTFGTVVGVGSLESYEFEVGEITEIKMLLFCNIDYYSAPSETVTLEMHPNLMEYIIVNENAGVLTVNSSRSVSWQPGGETPVLKIGTPNLRKVTLYGAGTFTAHDKITGDSFSLNIGGAGRGRAEVEVESLWVDMSGAGDFQFSGSADFASLDLAGAGEISALELRTREANITLAGVGSVKISCSERLTVKASGVGSVEYRGSPILDINKGGVVSVKQVD